MSCCEVSDSDAGMDGYTSGGVERRAGRLCTFFAATSLIWCVQSGHGEKVGADDFLGQVQPMSWSAGYRWCMPCAEKGMMIGDRQVETQLGRDGLVVIQRTRIFSFS